jgi:hypothetical protein
MTHMMTNNLACGIPDGHKGKHRSPESLKRRAQHHYEHGREQYRTDPIYAERRRAKFREWRAENLIQARESVRRHRERNYFVYALFFPMSKVLKIGVGWSHKGVLNKAKERLEFHHIFHGDGHEIWSIPTTAENRYLLEARLQAEHSYSLTPWHKSRSHRMSEWFETDNLSAEDLRVILKHCLNYVESRNEADGGGQYMAGMDTGSEVPDKLVPPSLDLSCGRGPGPGGVYIAHCIQAHSDRMLLGAHGCLKFIHPEDDSCPCCAKDNDAEKRLF